MYRYENEKSKLFTEEGLAMYVAIRDRAKVLLRDSGAFTMGAVIRAASSGESWVMLACVDRMVDIGEIREVTKGMNVAGQNRVFVGID